MTIEHIEVWMAHGDSGSEYRTGPVIAYCSTEHIAREAARDQGWYGSDGAVTNCAALRIEGNVWLLREREPVDLDGAKRARDAAARQAALAKLTPEEREVLGLGGKA